MQDNKELIINKIQQTLSDCSGVNKMLVESLELFNSGMNALAIKRIESATAKLESCVSRLEHIKANSGITEELTEAEEKSSIVCAYDYNNNIFKVTFPTLLPVLKDVRDKSGYNKQVRWKMDYLSAFNTFLANHDIERYKTKCIIYFLHHYGTSSVMADVDNFEIKGIIDVIASHLLIDDSPKWVSLYQEGVIEDIEESYSEVFVIPKHIFSDCIS